MPELSRYEKPESDTDSEGVWYELINEGWS